MRNSDLFEARVYKLSRVNELLFVVHQTEITQLVRLFAGHLVEVRVTHHCQERSHVVGVDLLTSQALLLGSFLLCTMYKRENFETASTSVNFATPSI